MIIAELFVNLGIKGAEKTIGALSGIEKGLKGVGGTSLEAKAAIVGAMYALERLFAKSGQAGTDLTNFNALLGGSAKTLQQYQYAARQVGVSNQETENSFKTLSSSMTKLRMGEGAPKGYAQVAMLTGGITSADVDRYMQNPDLLLQKLQLYAQKEKRLGIRNEALKSFGLSDNMIAALSRNAFNPRALQRAPTYSDNEIKQLDKANIAWSNLGTKIEMAIGHLNAAHGGQLVKDITDLTDKVLSLTTAFLKLAEATHFFEWLNKSVQGLTMLIDALTSSVNNLKTPEGRSELAGDAKDAGNFLLHSGGQVTVAAEDVLKDLWASFKKSPTVESLKTPSGREELLNGFWSIIKGANSGFGSKEETTPRQPKSVDKVKTSEKVMNFFKQEPGVFKPVTNDIFGLNPPSVIPQQAVKTPEEKPSSIVIKTPEINKTLEKSKLEKHQQHLKLVVPKAPLAPTPQAAPTIPRTGTPPKAATTQNFNVNQSFSYASDGKDHRQAADTMKKAVTEAFRQMSSQVQGS